MALGDFSFDPPTGHNNTSVFPDYPPRDQVRPLMQKLFDQIKTWLNGDVKTFVNGIDTALTSHKAESVQDVGGVHGLEIETGTWTPRFGATTADGTHTYSSRDGTYVKIGNVVTIRGELFLTAKDPAISGSFLSIKGVPFLPKKPTAVILSGIINITLPSGKTSLTSTISTSGSMALVGIDFIGASTALDSSHLTNTSGIQFEITYEI